MFTPVSDKPLSTFQKAMQGVVQSKQKENTMQIINESNTYLTDVTIPDPSQSATVMSPIDPWFGNNHQEYSGIFTVIKTLGSSLVGVFLVVVWTR
jgi:hypothetical protein